MADAGEVERRVMGEGILPLLAHEEDLEVRVEAAQARERERLEAARREAREIVAEARARAAQEATTRLRAGREEIRRAAERSAREAADEATRRRRDLEERLDELAALIIASIRPDGFGEVPP